MKHRSIFKLAFVTMIFVSMYGLLHIMNRSFANDMPLLLATQGAKIVDAYGVNAVNTQPTDLANNPVPFIVVYDKNSKPLAGTGYLKDKPAQMPVGVINHATPGKPHAVTWAPRKDIRIASVTVKAKDYYIVGGQSLKATESRDRRLLLFTLASYALTLVAVFASTWLTRRYCQPLCSQCARTHVSSCTCKGQCVCQGVSEKSSASTTSEVKTTSVKKPAPSKKRTSKTPAKKK